MILSQTAIYALRVLAVLVSLGAEENLSAAELSDRTAVPRQYINKVLQPLVASGIVASTRGRRGGFHLAQPAEDVRLGEVLDALSMPLEVGHCAFHVGSCDVDNPCALHGVWSRLQDCVFRWANETTLADLDMPAD